MGSNLGQNLAITNIFRVRNANSSKCKSLGPKLHFISKFITYTHLALPSKDRTIKGLVVCNFWNVCAFGPTIKVKPLLSTVPRDIIQKI